MSGQNFTRREFFAVQATDKFNSGKKTKIVGHEGGLTGEGIVLLYSFGLRNNKNGLADMTPINHDNRRELLHSNTIFHLQTPYTESCIRIYQSIIISYVQ